MTQDIVAEMSISQIRGAVEERFREAIPNLILDNADWSRFEFAASLAKGESVADIGTGHGVMIHMLSMKTPCEQLTAVDIKTHSQALLLENATYIEKSITDPNWDVPIHDTVICMEVIEHLESTFNDRMLKNLRSIAGRRLIVTVPYNEPEPLWWHDRPGGHRQKFTLETLGRLFPSAVATIQPRYGVDWVFVVEDKGLDHDGFRMVPKDDMLKLLENA